MSKYCVAPCTCTIAKFQSISAYWYILRQAEIFYFTKKLKNKNFTFKVLKKPPKKCIVYEHIYRMKEPVLSSKNTGQDSLISLDRQDDVTVSSLHQVPNLLVIHHLKVV